MPIETNVNFSLVEQYFHISPKGMEEPLLHIPGRQILDGPTMLGILQQGQTLLRGKGLDISASYLGLTLFNLVATIQLFLAQYNQWLDIELDHIALEIENHGDHAHVGYKIALIKKAKKFSCAPPVVCITAAKKERSASVARSSRSRSVRKCSLKSKVSKKVQLLLVNRH